MELSYVAFVLYHYARRYVYRISEVPDKRDLDPVLARTVLTTCGDIGNAITVLDAWFNSSRPAHPCPSGRLGGSWLRTGVMLSTFPANPKESIHE
jgi:hypothetical protein